MTTEQDVDVVRAFTDAIPRHARGQLHMTQTVAAMIHAAIRDHGWTVQQLARECGRDLGDVVNAGAVITHRLRHAAGHPPPAPASAAGLPVVPLCGDCADGWIEDPVSRLPIERCSCRSTPKREATADGQEDRPAVHPGAREHA